MPLAQTVDDQNDLMKRIELQSHFSLLAAQLYGVSFWWAVGALATCPFFAAIIPAGRAASISPIRALRTE